MNKDVDQGVVLQIRENHHLIVLTQSGEFVKAHTKSAAWEKKFLFIV